MRAERFGPMLNVYPDSLGGSLGGLAELLASEEMAGAFSSCYLLPSVYHSDLDRGFSVIDYDLNEALAGPEDLAALRSLGLELKLDLILNHASVQSPQFQDLLKRGEASAYRDFFIDWNQFWAGHGTMTAEGYIQPEQALIKEMFFRKPGLPILMVRFPDGREVPYWNTFYQEIRYPETDGGFWAERLGLAAPEAERLADCLSAQIQSGGTPDTWELPDFAAYRPAIIQTMEERRTYLGQMDLNVRSPLVWDFYRETLKKLAGYGARLVRLDAFAYAEKAVGARNFLNEPATWELLDRLKELADPLGIRLLPEIHASYGAGTYRKIAERGYLTYDFFLPGLILDAIENHRAHYLAEWAEELRRDRIQTVNMLGCHDGIPLLDLEGLLKPEEIDALLRILLDRGGYVKNLHGQKNVYYQVNMTYFSALGEAEDKLLLARAIQIFMPGRPQVWYLDLFAGSNDYEAVKRAGAGGHKEINRTDLSREAVEAALERPVVQRQIALLRFRNTCAAFGEGAELRVSASEHRLTLSWANDGHTATLSADLRAGRFTIHADGVPVMETGV